MSAPWTHKLRVRMENRNGMHARPAILLYAYLRRARPGTRFGLVFRDQRRDFGEVSSLRPLKLVGLGIRPGEEVLALASGPDAEGVLRAVARVFAWRTSGTLAAHAHDWALLENVLGGELEGVLEEMEAELELLCGLPGL